MKNFEIPEWRIDKNGSRVWYLPSRGETFIHRLGGPAIEHLDGSKEWWVNGVRHRKNGPAIIFKDGSREWWYDGRRHRLDGPACEGKGYVDGRHWFIDGKHLPNETVEKWIKECEIDLTSNEGMLAFKIRWSGGE